MDAISTEYLAFRRIGFLTPLIQKIVIVGLFFCTVLVTYFEYTTKGTMLGYPPSIHILFVPIYEEILFRGLLLVYLMRHTSVIKAVVITSILFALWHLKNIFVLSPASLMYQMAYAGIIISPILSYITLKTKSMWPGVILHYLNNLVSPLSWIILGSIFGLI